MGAGGGGPGHLRYHGVLPVKAGPGCGRRASGSI